MSYPKLGFDYINGKVGLRPASVRSSGNTLAEVVLLA